MQAAGVANQAWVDRAAELEASLAAAQAAGAQDTGVDDSCLQEATTKAEAAEAEASQLMILIETVDVISQTGQVDEVRPYERFGCVEQQYERWRY